MSNNPAYIKAIQQGKLPKESETLTEKDRFNEFVMTGLRTIWGVSFNEVEDRFGQSFKNQLLNNAQYFVAQKLLVIKNDGEKSQFLKATEKGKFLIDGIVSDLFMI